MEVTALHPAKLTPLPIGATRDASFATGHNGNEGQPKIAGRNNPAASHHVFATHGEVAGSTPLRRANEESAPIPASLDASSALGQVKVAFHDLRAEGTLCGQAIRIALTTGDAPVHNFSEPIHFPYATPLWRRWAQ